LRDSLPIDMLLSAVSFLVVAQSSSKVPEGLMNNPVQLDLHKSFLCFNYINFSIPKIREKRNNDDKINEWAHK